MKMLKSIYLIINYKTFIVTILSLVSTWLCERYDIHADFPLNLVALAIVFPVVFSIDSAYKRRERALGYLSEFKGICVALYQASRDWIETNNSNYQEEIKQSLIGIYRSVRELFARKEEDSPALEKKIFSEISELSVKLQEFRKHGLAGGEISRISQYISKISITLENMKTIYHYRTPITLRAYSKVFIYSFPILYGPYFVYTSRGYTSGLEYLMPVLFSFILVSLDNIQVHLEDPYDQVGEDDIKFDVEDFEKNISV